MRGFYRLYFVALDFSAAMFSVAEIASEGRATEAGIIDIACIRAGGDLRECFTLFALCRSLT